MSAFASKTTVSPAKSRFEIETTVARYGATHFGTMTEPQAAKVAFRLRGWAVRFVLPLPDPKDKRFTRHPKYSWKTKTAIQATAAYEQDVRQRWRALALCIKAKLEAVESGITSFEEEFLPHLVLDDGGTVGDRVLPMLAAGARSLPALPEYSR